MKSPFARRAAEEPATSTTPAYAFCERVTAGPTTPWHIRTVGPEGLKYGGGVPDTALCSRLLGKGWDLELPVTQEKVLDLNSGTHENGAHLVCPDCVVRYLVSTEEV